MKELQWSDYVAWGPKLPNGAFSEYDMEAICSALQAIPKGGVYVEIGVDQGRSLAWARSMADPSVSVHGIDIRHQINTKWFKDKKNWHFQHMSSAMAAKDWILPIDVLFIDGNHDYEFVLEDWGLWSRFVKPGGKIFFHDCDETSGGVVKVFKGIKWPKVLSRKEMDDRNTSMARVDKPND